MKKLMMFAAAMTIVGSTFAAVGVYDYKATVKNVNLKKTTVTLDGYKYTAFVKFIESSSLYGYLINSCDNCGSYADDGWGYLVVARKNGTMAKIPKILPADLLVKWWNPKFKAATSYQAEGYLFTGKGKADWPYQALGTWDSGLDYVYTFGSDMTTGMGTRFLFGTYNDYEYDSYGIPVRFFDAWLDHAGFGKAITDSTDGGCGVDSSCTALDSLSGTLIGGLFLCYPNSISANGSIYAYEGNLCGGIALQSSLNAWLGTTDVITGTWSIKRNWKVEGVAVTAAEIAFLDQIDQDGEALADAEIDAYVKAAGQKINSAYGFANTATGVAKPNGLLTPAFTASFGM